MERYILTDLGNVIASFQFRSDLIKKVASDFGIENLRLDELFKVDGSIPIEAESFYEGLDTGNFSVFDIWKGLVEQHDALKNLCPYNSFLLSWQTILKPIEGVIDLYCSLQESFPLVLISNGDSEGVRHFIKRLNDEYRLIFEKVFISAEQRCKKPKLFGDVTAFLLNRNISLSDCVFIDDLLPYVQAAQQLGIPALQFNGTKQDSGNLKAHLAALGFC